MRILNRFIFLLVVLCVATSLSAQQITKKRGKVKLYHANGKIKAKGKVKNYKRRGEWNYYAPEGHLVRRAHFVNDTVDGQYTEYFPTSFVSVQGTYCMNQKCGNWKSYDSEARLISDENFANGVQNGTQRFWYQNGKLRDSIEYKQGIIQYRKQWYSGGGLKTIETYDKGLAEGRWVVYPESPVDTFAYTVDDYHLGVKHGWHYLWNGKSLIEAYHYSEGLPDGSFTRYEYDGDPLVIYNYEMGKLEGSTTYFKGGVIIKQENYTGDLKHGVQIEYNRFVKPLKREWYTTGELDSVKMYHPNGGVAIHRIYDWSNETSNYTEWDSSGVLLMKGKMHNELRDGEWTTYYPNGKVRSITNYENGKIVGLYTKYYPNGKKMIQYTFLPIGTNTMPDVWNEKGKPLKMGSKEYNEIVEGNRPGEIINDPSEYNRSIIDHRINESASTVDGPGVIYEEEAGDREFSYDERRPINDSDQVYSVCEYMPEFPGGIDSMLAFIRRNFIYSVDAHDKQGKVYVQYIVETDGHVTNVKVLRGIPGAPELDAEAVRLVSDFPVHKPAKMSGSPVRCYSVVPIRFEPNR